MPTRPTATRRPPPPLPADPATGSAHGASFACPRGPGNSTGLQQEQAAEDADPHEVDEVPVVPDGLEHVGLAGVAALTTHASPGEDNGPHPEGHVESVDARHDEEQRPVRVQSGTVVRAGEVVPFVERVAEEGSAEDETDDDPLHGFAPLAALLRPHADLERRARHQEDDAEDPGLDVVEVCT